MKNLLVLLTAALLTASCAPSSFDVSGLADEDAGLEETSVAKDSAKRDTLVPDTFVEEEDTFVEGPDTLVPDDTIVDSGPVTDSFVPDTFVEKDSFVPDTFVLKDTAVTDSFVPDTFVPDTFVPDTAIDVPMDVVTYPPVDACPGGGAAGEVVIGVCKPSSGGPGFLGVALRVYYPSGTISPNEEWKNPWSGCSSSTTADCICCHVKPTSGAAMPVKSDVDFRAGTSTSAGSPVASWYSTSASAVGSYYGYWGPTQVGYAPNGTFPPSYKGRPNAIYRPIPSTGIDPNDIVFHYE